jgi:hypothetical protein
LIEKVHKNRSYSLKIIKNNRIFRELKGLLAVSSLVVGSGLLLTPLMRDSGQALMRGHQLRSEGLAYQAYQIHLNRAPARGPASTDEDAAGVFGKDSQGLPRAYSIHKEGEYLKIKIWDQGGQNKPTEVLISQKGGNSL